MKSKILTAIGGVLAVAMVAQAAPKLTPCTMEEMARYGATHYVCVQAQDLAGVVASNTAWAVTNTVSKPCSLKFVSYVLDTGFNNAKTYTNGLATTTNSISVSVGTSTTAGKWINGLQAAADQTPTVLTSFGTDYTVTTGATNAAATVASPILDAQTSDVNLVVTIGAPGAGNTLSAMVRGQVRAFFRILGPQ